MRTLLSYAWKTVVCALAYTAGSALGAALAAVLGAALPAMPPGADPARLMRAAFLASLILGASLGPLASGLRTGYLARFLSLGLFSYVCLGANTALETAIFTRMGGAQGIVVLFLPAALACAAAAAALFRPGTTPEKSAVLWSRFKSQFGPSSWAWRLGAAVVAFPVVYLAFGLVVEPFVIDSYRAGAFGLTLPGWGQILPTQLLRSVLFLSASVPLIALWGGSRLGLGLSLGLANFTLVGLFGMLQAFWLPIPMRLIHGGELVADSFVYAALLVLLLVRRTAAPRPGDGPPPSGRLRARS